MGCWLVPGKKALGYLLREWGEGTHGSCMHQDPRKLEMYTKSCK